MGRDAKKFFSPNVSYGLARLARFTSEDRAYKEKKKEDRAYGASRLPKTSENDCFAVYL